MKNFGTLYRFELKKILKNRMTKVMLAILFAIAVLEAVVPAFSVTRDMREARSELDGRLIDDALLNEMYPNIDTYGEKWNSDNQKYYGIAYVEQCSIAGDNPLADYSAEDIYNQREESILAYMEYRNMSDSDITWWQTTMQKVKTPFRYVYAGGPLFLAQGLSTLLLILMLLSALCLTTVFTIEHRQRTDQILLSSRNGRKETYFIKICAGISTIIMASFLATLILTILVFVIYGTAGFDGIIQLEVPLSPYPFTMGQFILIQLIIMITAGILYAVFAMAVSEFTKNSLAVMGIMVGLYLLGQIDFFTDKVKLLSQLKSLLPSNVIPVYSLMEYRLVHVGDGIFTIYAVAPVLYLLLSVMLIIAGCFVYERFQVTGR
jgi:hypothetical protein